jgi:Protein of unknown function (DUF1615)
MGRLWSACLGCCVLALGCRTHTTVRSSAAAPPPAPSLTAAEIGVLIPGRTPERRAWSDAIFNALVANGVTTDRESACAVIAVIEQESGFNADPVVPGLARLVAARVEQYKSRLGPAGDPLFTRLLSGRAPDDPRTFQQRLATVRTERDVDLLFRDLLAYYEVNHPDLYAVANLAGKLVDVNALADLNPITTAGSMQVSVRFASDWARARKGMTATPAIVRESLYTRTGGVYYGTARLLAYPVRYDQWLFRFADYNAGFYSSRNAALQSQLARLTGRPLALDGDLLAYDRNGDPRDEVSRSMAAVLAVAQQFSLHVSEPQIRRDLLLEKTLSFEDTATYRAIKAAIAGTSGGADVYATLPQVTLTSPKLSRARSTAWFAQSVDHRFRACTKGNVSP